MRRRPVKDDCEHAEGLSLSFRGKPLAVAQVDEHQYGASAAANQYVDDRDDALQHQRINEAIV